MMHTKLHSILLISLISLPCVALAKEDVGALGWGRTVAAFGVFGTGDRNGFDGSSFAGRLDLAAFAKETLYGNRAGYEMSLELGYERYGEESETGSTDLTQGPLIFDLSVGFPLTLLELGDGGPGSIRLSVAPGFGMSVQEAYGYLRGRLATVILPETLTVDVSARYTPIDASHAWAEDTGLGTWSLQFAAQWTYDEDLAFAAFVELLDADLGVPGQGEPAVDGLGGASPFVPFERRAFQSLVRIGAGVVW